jgi:hypothetical protein
MTKNTLIRYTLIALVTSFRCDAAPESQSQSSQMGSGTIITSGLLQVLESEPDSVMNVYPLIYGFKINNGRFPESPQELLDFNNTSTNDPCINFDAYEVLTFTLEEDQSLTVHWKTKGTPMSEGSMTIDSSGEIAQTSDFKLSGTVD